MSKSIVITGASKGIGRAAADPLVELGWSVIGVARSSPRHFPGDFIETDLADQKQTYVLAKDLAARGDVFGIVNNVGVARHETIDAVDFEAFTTVMDLNVRPRCNSPKLSCPTSGPLDSDASSTLPVWLLAGLDFVQVTRRQKQL